MNATDVAVAVTDLGKSYRIYDRPQDRLKQAFFRWRRQFYREFWALRDVSFEVRRGEALGIVGRNGSGKSTLLQLIAGTLTPTEGEVRVAGRVAALLELGSGFNPDFTGRENVFMNGAILGLSQKEMEARFDGIAAFADIGEFLEQPVKTYSSGMYVRLAFSVATSVDPDILVIDEALAVGDMLFQHRCIQRIRGMIESGATLIFVSHDPDTVRALCSRGLWLERGRVRMLDSARLVPEQYMESLFRASNEEVLRQSADAAEDANAEPLAAAAASLNGDTLVKVAAARLIGGKGEPTEVLHLGESFTIDIELVAERDIEHVSVGFVIKDRLGIELTGESVFNKLKQGIRVSSGRRVHVRFSAVNNLRSGDYVVALRVNRVSRWDRRDNVLLYNDETAIPFRVSADPDQPMWFRFRHPFEVSVS